MYNAEENRGSLRISEDLCGPPRISEDLCTRNGGCSVIWPLLKLVSGFRSILYRSSITEVVPKQLCISKMDIDLVGDYTALRK